jgi:hypothetical protein
MGVVADAAIAERGIGMNARAIGERIDEFAKGILQEGKLFEQGALSDEEKIKLVDALGSALIMTGTSLMCEAGAPSDVVLSRAVGIISKYRKLQAREEQERAEKPRITLA